RQKIDKIIREMMALRRQVLKRVHRPVSAFPKPEHRQKPDIGISLERVSIEDAISMLSGPKLLRSAAVKGSLQLFSGRTIDESSVPKIKNRIPIGPVLAPERILQEVHSF